MSAEIPMISYLDLCSAFVQFAIKVAKDSVENKLRERIFREAFPRLSRSMLWFIVPASLRWRLLFAKFGASGVQGILTSLCREYFEKSWWIAETYFYFFKAECSPEYFRVWMDEASPGLIHHGLTVLAKSYRVEFTQACLACLSDAGFGANCSIRGSELRALVENLADCLVLPIHGGFDLRSEPLK